MSLLQFVGIGEVNNHPCQVGSHTNQRERVHCNSGFTKVITSIVVKLWWCPFQVPTRGNELCWDENKIKESKKKETRRYLLARRSKNATKGGKKARKTTERKKVFE